MATPSDNTQLLINYWANGGNVFDLAHAMQAMKELVGQAANSADVRANVFADSSIFELALLDEPRGQTDSLIDSAQRGTSAAAGAVAALQIVDRDMRPPRQIMLDGIHDAAMGGLFSSADPSGLSSWISSPAQASDVIQGVIASDPSPGAKAAMLRVIRDLALPADVVRALAGSSAFASLDDQLSRSQWPTAIRVVLQTLSAAARGRIQGDAAKAALASLPTFGAGGFPTIPAPPVPVWANPRAIAAGVLGLITGGIAAAKLAHRRR